LAEATGQDRDQSGWDFVLLDWFSEPLQGELFSYCLNQVLDDRPSFKSEKLTFGSDDGYVYTGTAEDFFISLVNVLERHDAHFPEKHWAALCQVYALYHVCIPSIAATFASGGRVRSSRGR
jgi:hypothetical protein